MQLFIEELKKMMFDQKSILILLITIIAGLSALVVVDTPSNANMENNKTEYLFYLEYLQGKIDDDKAKFIEDEAVKIIHGSEALDILYTQYYQNEIEIKFFQDRERQLFKQVENKAGFEVLHQLYLYTLENVENRYLLYTNGWDGVYNSDILQWVFLIGLLLVVSNIIYFDYKNGMEILNRVSYRGNTSWKSIVNYKIIIVFSTTVLLWFVATLIQFTFFNLKYGLDGGAYPIQSIHMFRNSTKAINLHDAYLLIATIKLFGYLLYSFFIMFVVTITKNRTYSVFLGVILIILPNLGIGEMNLYYILPLALLLGDGYLIGNEYLKNMYTNETTIIFKEFTLYQIGITLFISLVFFVSFIVVIKNNQRNKHCSIRCKSFNRLYVIVLFVICTLAGCSDQNKEEVITYNYSQRYEYTLGEYRYYAPPDRTGIYREDLKSGEKEKADRSPFDVYVQHNDVIFGDGNSIYYSRYNIEDSPFFRKAFLMGAVWYNFQIVQIKLDSWEEKIIFEEVMNERQDTILKRDNNSKWDFLKLVNAFFLNDTEIYVITRDGLWCINRRTNAVNLIEDIDSKYNIAFDGEYIYYVGERYKLKKYDVTTKKISDCEGIVTKDFKLMEGTIIYKNFKNDESESVYPIQPIRRK
ncbi:hypothetical protein [Fusibacter bizertensis]